VENAISVLRELSTGLLRIKEGCCFMDNIIIYPSSLLYQEKEGTMEPVDTVVISKSYSPLLPDYFYTVQKNTLKFDFKPSPVMRDFIRVCYPDLDGDGNDDVVTFTVSGLFMYDDETKESFLIQEPRNVQAFINENGLVYPEIFTGIDLSLTSNANLLKENLILREEVTSIIPDPFVIGHNPDNCKLVIGFKIAFNGELLEDANRQLLLKREDGKTNLFIQPITAKSKSGEISAEHLYQQLNNETYDFFYGIDYYTTQRTSYPIEIDPTIQTNTGVDFGGIESAFDQGIYSWVYSTTLSTANSGSAISLGYYQSSYQA
jgi:hypothetical protein